MPLSLLLKTWEGVNSIVTSPETGLATKALMLRHARKYRGVTVSKAVAPLFLNAMFLKYWPSAIFVCFVLRYSLVFKNLHAGTHVT